MPGSACMRIRVTLVVQYTAIQSFIGRFWDTAFEAVDVSIIIAIQRSLQDGGYILITSAAVRTRIEICPPHQNFNIDLSSLGLLRKLN